MAIPTVEINERPAESREQYKAFQSQGLKLLAHWIYLEEKKKQLRQDSPPVKENLPIYGGNVIG